MTETGQRVPEYLTVGEAAAILGVSPWTLRNWDKAGRLKPRRHPKNGYRIYRHEDLQAVLTSGDLTLLDRGHAPRIDWSAMSETEHFVQFYENDAFLVEAVSGFIGAGLKAGEGCAIVATAPHRAAIEAKLAAARIDVPAKCAMGQF